MTDEEYLNAVLGAGNWDWCESCGGWHHKAYHSRSWGWPGDIVTPDTRPEGGAQ